MIRFRVIEGERARRDPIHELLQVEYVALRAVAREFGAELAMPTISTSVVMDRRSCAAAYEAITPIDQAALDYHIDRRLPGEAADELRARWRRMETALKAGAAGDGLEIRIG
jgi:hypothetical protein